MGGGGGEGGGALSKRDILVRAGASLAAGVALCSVFSEPLVDSLTNLSRASGVPAFAVGFVLTPLASNSSEFVSSLKFAARKRITNMSLTLSQSGWRRARHVRIGGAEGGAHPYTPPLPPPSQTCTSHNTAHTHTCAVYGAVTLNNTLVLGIFLWVGAPSPPTHTRAPRSRLPAACAQRARPAPAPARARRARPPAFWCPSHSTHAAWPPAGDPRARAAVGVQQRGDCHRGSEPAHGRAGLEPHDVPGAARA